MLNYNLLYSAAAVKTEPSAGELLDMRGEDAGGGAEIFPGVEERRPPGALPPGQPQDGPHQPDLDFLQDRERQTVAAVSRVEIIFPV